MNGSTRRTSLSTILAAGLLAGAATEERASAIVVTEVNPPGTKITIIPQTGNHQDIPNAPISTGTAGSDWYSDIPIPDRVWTDKKYRVTGYHKIITDPRRRGTIHILYNLNGSVADWGGSEQPLADALAAWGCDSLATACPLPELSPLTEVDFYMRADVAGVDLGLGAFINTHAYGAILTVGDDGRIPGLPGIELSWTSFDAPTPLDPGTSLSFSGSTFTYTPAPAGSLVLVAAGLFAARRRRA